MRKKDTTKPKKKGDKGEKAPKKHTLKSLMASMKPAEVRFTMLYMGAESGKCFNNATLSYITAYELFGVSNKKFEGAYTNEYLNAKSAGYTLLTKTHIQELRHLILMETGFDVESIKKRYSEIAYQNHNLPLALSATDRVAKITGLLKEENKQVDIPQLTELSEQIKKILSP